MTRMGNPSTDHAADWLDPQLSLANARQKDEVTKRQA